MSMIVYLVYTKGEDYESIEAFETKEDAQSFLANELKYPGTSGKIKTVDFDTLQDG